MNIGYVLKYVVPALFAMVGSVAVVRIQQDPRNEQGAVGYQKLADSVNRLQFNQERLQDEVALLSRVCVPQRQTPEFQKPPFLKLQSLAPLQRVPSRLEHLPIKD